jgi:peptide/nickel transport system permease protein
MMKKKFELKLGICLGMIMLIMSLVSFFWTPYDYNMMDSSQRFLSPSEHHILGTDNFGRDIFSRIMAGGRNSLFVAVFTVAGAALLGTLLGFTAAYFGGIANEIIMRLIDVLNSFPGIVLALLFAALMDAARFSLFVALIILFTPSYVRVMRTGVLQYKDASFVKAERIMGAGFFRITFIHILPNILPSLLSASVIGLSNAILAEAAMSYLGMGIQPPEPSWGRMLQESQVFFFNAPWLSIMPGIFLMLTVAAFHLLGEGLRCSFSK